MATVPTSNYYVQDAYANNGTNNIYVYAYIPYFLSSLIVWKCSWNASGNVQSPYSSWSGSLSNVTGNYANTGTGSGGGTQTYNLACSLSAGNFTATGQQTGSTVNAGNSCTATGRSWTFNITQVVSTFTFISATNNTSSNMVIMRLPNPASSIGQMFYICNWGNTNIAGFASYNGEAIDGVTQSSFRLPQWACVGLTPNEAGTSWNIMSYYGGTIPNTGVYSVNGTTLNSPVAVYSNTGTSKTCILPNPASWGKGNVLYYNAYQTVNSGTYGQPAVYTNGFFRQNTTANLYFNFYSLADVNGRYDHNCSVMFISDGTYWYIASIFDGQYCLFDNATNLNGSQLTSSNIILVGGASYASTLVGPSVVGDARVYYAKLNVTTTNPFGLVLHGNSDATRGPLGSTWNRVYKNSSTVNYSAFTVVQVRIGANSIINFPVGMYPSAY